MPNFVQVYSSNSFYIRTTNFKNLNVHRLNIHFCDEERRKKQTYLTLVRFSLHLYNVHININIFLQPLQILIYIAIQSSIPKTDVGIYSRYRKPPNISPGLVLVRIKPFFDGLIHGGAYIREGGGLYTDEIWCYRLSEKKYKP